MGVVFITAGVRLGLWDICTAILWDVGTIRVEVTVAVEGGGKW